MCVVGIRIHVRDVLDAAAAHRARGSAAAAGRHRVPGADRRDLGVGHAVRRHEVEQRAVEAEYVAERRVAQAAGIFRDRVEHGLHVRRRPADHAQNLAGRPLLLERLLRGLRPPHVRDGDRRLLREGLDQRDVVGREQARLAAPEEDAADPGIVAHQRHHEHGAKLHVALVGAGVRELGVQQRDHVGQVDRRAVQDRATGERSAGERYGTRRMQPAVRRILGQRTDQRTFDDEYTGRVGPAQARGQLGHCLQDRLHVGRRRGHHAQDVRRGRLLRLRVGEALVGRAGVGGGKRTRAPGRRGLRAGAGLRRLRVAVHRPSRGQAGDTVRFGRQARRMPRRRQGERGP